MSYSRIEVVTTMSSLEGLQNTLGKAGVTGITVFQATGCGVQNGTFEYEEKQKPTMFRLAKEVVAMVVADDIVDDVVELVKKELYTGHIGDGKIFVSPVSRVIRVRTGEEGLDALK